jgi:hypothetical protein
MRHALGALLVRVAKADGAYLSRDRRNRPSLADLYNLNVVEAARCVPNVKNLRARCPTSELAHILSCDVTSHERDGLVRALSRWLTLTGNAMTPNAGCGHCNADVGMSPEAAAALRA